MELMVDPNLKEYNMMDINELLRVSTILGPHVLPKLATPNVGNTRC